MKSLPQLNCALKVVISGREDTSEPMRRPVDVAEAILWCHRYTKQQCADFTWFEYWWHEIPGTVPNLQTLFMTQVLMHPNPPMTFNSTPILWHDISAYWKQVIAGDRAYLLLSWMPVRPAACDTYELILFDVGPADELYDQAVAFFQRQQPERVCLVFCEDRLAIVSTPKCMDVYVATDAIGTSLGGGVYLFGDVLLNLADRDSTTCVGREVLKMPIRFMTSDYVIERCTTELMRERAWLDKKMSCV